MQIRAAPELLGMLLKRTESLEAVLALDEMSHAACRTPGQKPGLLPQRPQSNILSPTVMGQPTGRTRAHQGGWGGHRLTLQDAPLIPPADPAAFWQH